MSPSATVSLVPELEDLRKQIEAIAADARKLTAGISERQFNWPPAPGRWSMEQCLAHLNVVGAIQAPRIDASIRAAREQGVLGQGPCRHGFVGNLFVSLTEPPPKIKFKARPSRWRRPRLNRPPGPCPRFSGRAKVVSPIADWLHFTLGQSFALLAGRQRRHLWQAWQVRNDPKFPAS